jgi:predicted kinase
MPNKQPTLYMLVGLPGSGKSTWINRKTDKIGYPHIVLSTDEYIESEALREGKLYHEVFKEYIKDAEKFMQEDLETGIRKDIDIYWDQTNLTAKTRAKKLAKIPAHYKKIVVVFEIPEEEIKRRLEKRKNETGKFINPGIVENMLKTYERPTLGGFSQEDFDEMIIVKE